MLYFTSDYMEGAHPAILEKINSTNMEKTGGYGTDSYTEEAKAKIREALGIKTAQVFFLIGGTQTNKVVISSLLRPYEGVIAAKTGHIAVHEAGAVENGGHKVIELDHNLGKLCSEDVEKYMECFIRDQNREHTVKPGMVYISQPTEYGTLYSKQELEAVYKVCRKYSLLLFADGARLGYALASSECDLSLKEFAQCVDVFYIGGTKCGALFGEAVVFTSIKAPEGFFSIIKQEGALLAKGRLLGIQFSTLFTGDLYIKICEKAVKLAAKIKKALKEKGYKIYIDSPTNQQFVVVKDSFMEKLSKKVSFGYMESCDDTLSVIRFCTSWATDEEDVERLIKML